MLLVFIAAGILPLINGCATGFPNGLIYTHVNLPVTASQDYSQIKDTKVGIASCEKVLGLFAWGNASIAEAVKNCPAGPIMKIQRVEYHAWDLLGCGTYETIVYGE